MAKKTYPVHQQPQTISLIFDKDFRHQDPTVHPRFEQFKDSLSPALQKVADYFNQMPIAQEQKATHGEDFFVRLIIVKLQNEGIVHPHGDAGFSLMHSHRIHMPVFVDGEVLFKIGPECRTLQAGTIWEINNKCLHAVKNISGKPRIHVIADWVIPGERCCCGQRLRLDGACNPESCQETDNMRMRCSCLRANG